MTMGVLEPFTSCWAWPMITSVPAFVGLPEAGAECPDQAPSERSKSPRGSATAAVAPVRHGQLVSRLLQTHDCRFPSCGRCPDPASSELPGLHRAPGADSRCSLVAGASQDGPAAANQIQPSCIGPLDLGPRLIRSPQRKDPVLDREPGNQAAASGASQHIPDHPVMKPFASGTPSKNAR